MSTPTTKDTKTEVQPNIPNTLDKSVPAPKDYKNPVLSQAEEQRKFEEAQQKANDELRKKEGEQALEYVKNGITEPSESDIRHGMSHPSTPNRPGYAADPAAPYAGDDLQPTQRTLEEQKGGREALQQGAFRGQKA